MYKLFTRLFLFLVTGLFSFTQLNAQQVEHATCGTTDLHNRLMQTDAEYRMGHFKMEAEIQQRVIEFMENPERLKQARGTVYTIPCVVHVIHNGEAVGEGANISEDQARSAIDNMTDYFRNYLAPNESVDMEIEFCLATIDPDGKETNGINRINAADVFSAADATKYKDSGVSNGGGNPGVPDSDLKALIIWDHLEYYNIWVVNKINGGNQSGVQGYANFPTFNATEGTVILANAFGYDPDGSLGYNLKSFTRDNGTMVHEMGHALSLYHTFDDGDGNGNSCPPKIPEDDCLVDGDRVCDIDPHKSNLGSCRPVGSDNECVPGGVYTAVMSRNVMNYTNCPNLIFSQGQLLRVRATMEGECNKLPRACLVQQSNLDKTGCNGENPPSVRFTAADTAICSGSSVQFTDKTLYAPETWEWTFEGGTPATSTDQNPSIVYNTPGTYKVTLKCTNQFGADSLTKTFIEVQVGGASMDTRDFDICVGDSAKFNATGADTYSWSPSTGLSSTTIGNPIASPVDSMVYTCTAISSNGCETQITARVNIIPGPPISVDQDTSVCPLEPVKRTAFGGVSYEWRPASNVISGINSATATLKVSSPTTFTVIGKDADGCGTAETVTISVTASPIPEVTGLDDEYCDSDEAVQAMGTPAGGTLSGALSAGDMFNPSILGVGTYQVSYTYTDPSTGCVGTADKTVKVAKVPEVDFVGLPKTLCKNSPVATLSGVPEGGEFSGPGVDNMTKLFNPSKAGVGTHTITYVYSVGNCSGSAEKTIVVSDVANINILGAKDFFCRTDNAVQLSGEPSGGDITGDVDLNDVFDPATKAPGLYNVTYTLPTQAGGCKNSKTIKIVVGPKIPKLLGVPQSFCEGDTTIATFITQPEGGTTFGTGVTGNTLDASQLGLGETVIGYEIVDTNGCKDTATATVVLNANPVAGFEDLSAVICANEGIVKLKGSPDNTGVFKGKGVSFDNLDPKEAGYGPLTITYVYTDNNGCKDSAVAQTEIKPTEVILSGVGEGYCISDSASTFTATPEGGIFGGPGMNANGVFNPKNAGSGYHEIVYTFTDNFGCVNSDTQYANVYQLPDVTLNNMPEQICENDDVIALNGLPQGGEYTGPGTSAGLSVFDPNSAGMGSHTVRYTYIDRYGCVNFTEKSIEVIESPTVNMTSLEDTMCINEKPIELIAFPLGGVFSGRGVGSGLFSPEAAGIGQTKVSYTYQDEATGCETVGNLIVTILEKPAISLSGIPTSFCASDGMVLLNPVPSGGVWFGTGIIQPTQFDPAEADAGKNNLQYVYTDSFGCSNFQEIEVLVKAVGDVEFIDFRNVFCLNEPGVKIFTNPTGGEISGKGIFNGEYLPIYAVNGSPVRPFYDTVTYVVEFPNGCVNLATEVVTIIDELPEPGIERENGTIYTDFIEGLKYRWFRNGNLISGAIENSYSPASSGQYQVETYVSDFCASRSESMSFFATLIEDVENEVTLYPNPTSNSIFINGKELKNPVLISLTGNQVEVPVIQTDKGFEMNLEGLSDGIYFVRIKQGENIRLLKVLKKN